MPVGGGFTNCGCGPETTACENPTQPVATVGLCLADGTPIAVTVVMDCSGNVTSEGWIDLTTGAYTVGVPPAGAMACGDSRSVEVSGTFCDVDQTTGDVYGLVLIEYQYAADGSIAGVRLVDATSGDTYTPQGEVTTCPAGVEQPEKDLVVLCDTGPDGTVVTFVRDYARDENGTITGFSDYGLDGAPYTPAGSVGVCQCPTSFTTECWTAAEAEVRYDNTGGGDCGSSTPTVPGCGGDWTIQSWIIDGVDVVTEPVTFTAVGCGGDPARFHGAFAAAMASLDPDAGWEAAYKNVCLWFVRAQGADPARVYGDLVLDGIRTDGTPYPNAPFTLTPAATQDETRVTKVYARSCDGEITVSWLDEDGTPREAPQGNVTPCSGGTAPEPEPCRDTATLLLCDTDPACEAGGEPTATDEPNPSQYPNWVLGNWCLVQTPGEGAPVWAGGSVVLGPDPACPTSPSGDTMRTIGVQLKAGSPTATAPVPVTVSLRVTNNGPNPGVVGDGRFGLWNAATGTRLTHVNVQNSAPVGHQQTLTLTANVPAAELAAGQIVAVLDVETYQGAGEKAWTVDQFQWTADVPAAECETQFLRTVVTDCETGAVLSTTDTTLEGEPYTPVGEVGQCTAAGGECCPTPPEPDPVPDNEVVQLCDRVEGAAPVPFLRHLVYEPGAATPSTVTDTALDGVTPYTLAGEAGLCEDCPTSFNTECVAVIDRTEASYDNTSKINGVAGQCGSVQGPDANSAGNPRFGCAGGPFTITSWIVNGQEVIAEGGGRAFNGGDCGPGTPANPGMHQNWADALTTLDPTGATWIAQQTDGCGWHVMSVGGTGTVYGTMIVTGDSFGSPNGTWTLGPAQDCEETQYTKVYTQECDGTVSVSWLDSSGVEVAAPEGEQVPCGTGCSGSGAGQGVDSEALLLCDVQPDGTSVPFLRHVTYGDGGAVASVLDTGLDGFAPYTPAGTVGTCAVEAEPCPARSVLEACRCDDTTGDGIADTDYVELLGVDCDGAVTSLGTWTPDLSEPYTPVAPVECDTAGAEPPVMVGAHRVQVDPGGTWDAAGVPLLQSVTFTAHGGAGTVTTSDGTSTLFAGESVTWSLVRDEDAALVGPLSVTADTGTVTVAYTAVS